jgi:hypothetical protein
MKTYNVTTDNDDVIKVTTNDIDETIGILSSMLGVTIIKYEESVVQININVWEISSNEFYS